MSGAHRYVTLDQRTIDSILSCGGLFLFVFADGDAGAVRGSDADCGGITASQWQSIGCMSG